MNQLTNPPAGAPQRPDVSVIIPAYRCAALLPQAVQSVLAQGNVSVELIIVDDGSDDATPQVAGALAAQSAGKARLICQGNAGACAARNTGLAAAGGEFVLFLDADDWLEPGALRVMVDACRREGWDAVHGMCRYVTPDGQPTERLGGYTGSAPLFNALSGTNEISMPAMILIRRALLDEIGAFDPALKHCGDWDLWQRLARSTARIGHVDTVVCSYRMVPTSLSRNPRTLLRDAITVLRRIHGRDLRVKNPQPECSEGYPADWLAVRIAYFALYAAGLSIARGDESQIQPLLDEVPQWPELAVADIASSVFWAVCFARCAGPEDVPQFWPQVQPAVERLCRELEARLKAPGLGKRVVEVMNWHSDGRILGQS